MSVVCVLGATGAQGGSVCQVLLKNPKWQVRAITRNANSNAAKKLAAQVCSPLRNECATTGLTLP
jgi:uncharacterized protein YbjT (DUF2867 family)